MYSLPFFHRVSQSASAAGSHLAGCFIRNSSHSLSGCVCVVSFFSRSVAAQFARAWAARLPMRCGCKVRRAGGLFCVSVPVLVLSRACKGGV